MKMISAGIIICNNKILIAQRGKGKKPEHVWELPGGKQEDGETLQQCLKREIDEELGLEITVGDFFMSSDFSYNLGSFRLNAFFAQSDSQKINKMEAHEDYRWVSPQELKEYPFAPADIPIIEKLSRLSL